MVKLKVFGNINSADLVIKANTKLTNSIFIQVVCCTKFLLPLTHVIKSVLNHHFI